MTTPINSSFVQGTQNVTLPKNGTGAAPQPTETMPNTAQKTDYTTVEHSDAPQLTPDEEAAKAEGQKKQTTM